MARRMTEIFVLGQPEAGTQLARAPAKQLVYITLA
jgi:hypothetical protein